MRAKILIVAIISCFYGFSSTVIADVQTREIKDLVLITGGLGGKPGPATTKVVPYEQVKARSSLKLISPHPAKNPQQQTTTWSGIYTKDLFATAGFKLPNKGEKVKGTMVTFLASDNYNVEMPLDDILAADVLIATEHDGKKISWFEGGPQMVHPLGDAKLRDLYKTDAWWSWYVSAIVVGQPEARLDIVEGKTSRSLLLPNMPKIAKEKLSPHFPTSQKQAELPKTVTTHSSIFLKDLLAHVGVKGVKKVSAQTLHGQSVDLDIKTGSYRVIFAMEGRSIPVSMGGPVKICTDPDTPDINNCVYYVRGLNIQ